MRGNDQTVIFRPLILAAVLIVIVTATTACLGGGPRVTGSDPAPQADPVQVDQAVEIYFDEPMDPATLADAVTIEPGPPGPAPRLDLAADGRSLTVTPSPAWAPDTDYTLAVGREAQSAEGRPLRRDHQLTFTTAPPRTVTCARPRFSPAGDHVAWLETTADGAGELWASATAAPSPRRLLTDVPAGCDFAWLPDGTGLVAVTTKLPGDEDSPNRPTVVRVDLADGAVEPLALNAELQSPGRLLFRFSPDGQHLVVQNDMYLADAHSDYVRQLGVARGDGTGFVPCGNLLVGWSQGGANLLYLDMPGIGEGHDFDYSLYSCDLAAGTVGPVTGAGKVNNFGAAARSPDGAWFAYSDWQAEEVALPDGLTIARLPRDLWLMPGEGGPPRRLTQDQGHNADPAWGPDGQLFFAANRGDELGWDVWLMESVSEPQEAVNVTARAGYDGQPDLFGESIVLVSDASGAQEVWLTDPAGDAWQMLSGR